MYNKKIWKARKGSGLNRFIKSQETNKSVILENEPIAVTEPGTPFSVENMNNIEEGIAEAHGAIDTINAKIPNQASASNQLADKDYASNANNITSAITAGDATTGATQLAAGTYTVKAILQQLIHNIAKVFRDLIALSSRIDSVENLGDYAGSFDTHALLPKNKSGFTKVVTVNDWADIRTDENKNGAATRYIVSAINTSGVITWTYDITYSTDISGKQDKLSRTVGGNDNTTGTVTDTGGNLSVPVPVTVAAPAASNTQITAGTRSLRATIKYLIDNIAYLFANTSGTAFPASMIVTLTQDNKEGELASLYGGSWVKAINPAPRVLTGAYPGSAGTLNGTGTVSPGTVNLNIAATQGYTVTIQTCGVGPGVSVAIISSLDGTLQTIVGDSTGGSQKFNSVILRANETLSLKITGGNIGGYSVSWYSGVSKNEYIYFRI